MEQDYALGFAFQIAQAHAWRGDKDQAFAWLDRAYAIHDGGLVRLPFDPAMDLLRDDPRFAVCDPENGFPEMSLFAELKRRNVIRMAGLYLVGAWLIVQVAGTCCQCSARRTGCRAVSSCCWRSDSCPRSLSPGYSS